MTLFLDLDGPILDVAERYHRVHRDLVGPAFGGFFTTAGFWELKRDRKPVREILARCGAGEAAAAEYSRRWLEEIEAPERFATDVVHPGVAEALRDWARRHFIAVVTLRQSEAGARAELDRLGLLPLVGELWVGDPRRPEGWNTKAELIRRSPRFVPGSAVVGDTEIDIRAGKLAGLTTVGVLSGIRNRRLLSAESPDHLLDKLVDLPHVLPL